MITEEQAELLKQRVERYATICSMGSERMLDEQDDLIAFIDSLTERVDGEPMEGLALMGCYCPACRETRSSATSSGRADTGEPERSARICDRMASHAAHDWDDDIERNAYRCPGAAPSECQDGEEKGISDETHNAIMNVIDHSIEEDEDNIAFTDEDQRVGYISVTSDDPKSWAALDHLFYPPENG